MPRTWSHWPRLPVGVGIAIGLVLVTCTTEPTSPPGRMRSIAVRPAFAPGKSLAGVPVAVDLAHVWIARTQVDTLAGTLVDTLTDTLASFPPDADSVTLTLRVVLPASVDTLTVGLELDAGAQPLFAGSAPLIVDRGQAIALDIPISYVGPGRNVGSLALTPRDTVVTAGDSLQLRVVATDSSGAPVGAFYVSWSSSDPGVPVDAAGALKAPAVRERILVRAHTPSGSGDSTTVWFTPAATQLVKQGGDNQADTVGRALAKRLTVLVRAGDGLGVPNVPVSFRPVVGAGRVLDTLVISDSGGRAGARVALDTLAGVERFAATAPRLVPDTFGVTALPGAPTPFTVTPDSTLAITGAAVQFQAAPRDVYGNLVGGTTWISSDPGVASVDATGLARTFATGATVITASNGGLSAAGTLAVCDSAVRIAVNDFDITLAGGLLPSGPSVGLGLYKGTHVIFATGLLYGTSGQDLVLGFDTRGPMPGFASAPVCVTAAGPVHHTIARLRLAAGANGPAGLAVTQESFASASAGDNGYVLLRYAFTNAGTSALAGLFAGTVTDWDVYFDGTAFRDAVRFDATLSAGEVTESDTLTYPQILALVPIAGAGNATFQGYGNGADPTTLAGYFALLAGGVNPVVPPPSDIRAVVGIGPLDIPVGQNVLVYLALVGGDDRATFARNLAAARAKAASLGF